MRGILKKSLLVAAAVAMTGLSGCAVYVPRPGLVVGPAPVYVGGYYPRHYGYYGYYGWHHGYWR